MPGFHPNRTVVPLIPSGGSLSQAVFTGGKVCSIQMPAAWTAAAITFQGSVDGTTYSDIYDFTGTEVSVAVSASQLVTLDKFEGATYMKFRSGTSASPVNQGADRTLNVLVRKDPIPR